MTNSVIEASGAAKVAPAMVSPLGSNQNQVIYANRQQSFAESRYAYVRARSLSRAEWDPYREVIFGLYVNDNLTLADVGRVMREQFGFEAT